MKELEKLTKTDTADLAAVDFMLKVEAGLNLTGPQLSALFAVRRFFLHGAGMRINSNAKYDLRKETLLRVGLVSIFINALETVIPDDADVYSILKKPIENGYFAGHSIKDCLLHPNLQIADLLDPREMDFFAFGMDIPRRYT